MNIVHVYNNGVESEGKCYRKQKAVWNNYITCKPMNNHEVLKSHLISTRSCWM